MTEEVTGAGMEIEDINLPLDEIISRKATREAVQRPPRSRGFRRHHFQQRRPPPPPHPIPEQTTNVQFQPQPPYYQDQGFQPQPPYGWDPSFNPNLVEPSWIPPQPLGPSEVQFRRRQPLRKRGFNRGGGIQKPMRRRHTSRHSSRERPPPSQDPIQKQEKKCQLRFEDGVVKIVFQGVEVVKVNATGDVTLTTDGQQESGFLKMMNDVLSLINMEILGEEDKKESWKVKEARTLFRYFDGMCIKGKGEPSKTRAETIRKAFEQPNPKALEATLASNLAARRLGLAFDPMTTPSNAQFPGPGPHGVASNGGSICITQDQQLTRTSNYSISFLDQEQDQQGGVYNGVYPQGPDPMSQGGRFMHPY